MVLHVVYLSLKKDDVVKIVENNYVKAGGYFSHSLEIKCLRCSSIYLIESPDEISRGESHYDDERCYYVTCPCCKREQYVLKNLPQVVIDLIDDRYNASS